MVNILQKAYRVVELSIKTDERLPVGSDTSAQIHKNLNKAAWCLVCIAAYPDNDAMVFDNEDQFHEYISEAEYILDAVEIER